jgi:hypothetical protein
LRRRSRLIASRSSWGSLNHASQSCFSKCSCKFARMWYNRSELDGLKNKQHACRPAAHTAHAARRGRRGGDARTHHGASFFSTAQDKRRFVLMSAS